MADLERDPVDALVQTVLWADTPDGEEVEGIAPSARAFLKRAWDEFWPKAEPLTEGYEPNRVAHDLWLTAVGHGAGFWDGGYPEHGDELTRLARESILRYREVYVGDDGLLYIFGAEDEPVA